MFKFIIRARLERYVKKYFRAHPEVKLVAVAGSVGKTSTKIAIGTVLAEKFRVRLHEGNFNSDLSTPVAMLGVDYPEDIRNLKHWRQTFQAMRQRIKAPTDVDVIIQEVGTDAPGQVPHFGTYATPDFAVITAVSQEHMEFFKTMDAVAAEELSLANFSREALINRDDIAGSYAKNITNAHMNTYGTSEQAEYRFETGDVVANDGFEGVFIAPDYPEPTTVTLHIAGEHSIRAAVAAGALGAKMGMSAKEVAAGMAKIRAVPGRMNVLRGIKTTTLIDDSYNSSPLAAHSAIQTLYQFNAPQRIVVLGSMNELGESSRAEHEALGKLCDPMFIDHVITVGDDAAYYLAPAAQANGCHVVSFKSALSAGAYVNKVLEPGAVVLYKGSQGGIYLEEAVKMSLHSEDDIEHLVRQSDEWRAKKQAFFDTLTPGT